MANGIYLALSGAVAQSTAMDVNANNVANASSTGYKAERVRFSEVLSKARGRVKDSSFVSAGTSSTDQSPGNLTPSENPLDVALRGDGFMAVQTAHGTRYTRAGNLQLDGHGMLVTSDGNPLRSTSPDGKPIIVPKGSGNVTIAANGQVSAGGRNLGHIELRRFDSAQLSREGNNLYIAKGAPLAGTPEIVQGSTEESNFNIVRGVVDMVRNSRDYEATHRLIETYRDIDDRASRGFSDGG